MYGIRSIKTVREAVAVEKTNVKQLTVRKRSIRDLLLLEGTITCKFMNHFCFELGIHEMFLGFVKIHLTLRQELYNTPRVLSSAKKRNFKALIMQRLLD